jgi:hypothetical protein
MDNNKVKANTTTFAVLENENAQEKISRVLKNITSGPMTVSDIRVNTLPVGKEILVTITWNERL